MLRGSLLSRGGISPSNSTLFDRWWSQKNVKQLPRERAGLVTEKGSKLVDVTVQEAFACTKSTGSMSNIVSCLAAA